MNIKAAKQERRLLALFETMSDAGREMMLDYAEFLAQRYTRPVSLEPLDIPRPEQESVAAAIRRLADTFPMLDRGKLLGEASGLMAQHVMYARPAPEVIDQLEVVFRHHYTLFVERRQDDEPA